MITLYGINNCDTVKKTQKWLLSQQIDFQFYDFKKQPLTPELLARFISLSDWDSLLNKRSTTYRNLPVELKENLTDDNLFKAAIEQPTLLKRPLLLITSESNVQDASSDILHLGFKADNYQKIFNL
ncbi:MAG: Spx/MgsR family RNA polymerase-binding regulatory protein [Colwellia sp.]